MLDREELLASLNQPAADLLSPYLLLHSFRDQPDTKLSEGNAPSESVFLN